MTIEGPSTFVTDGRKSMTLKCHATDVYPSPVYTWDNIHCDSTNKNDVCTFSPKGERDNGKEVVCTVTNGLSTTKARYRLDLRCKFLVYLFGCPFIIMFPFIIFFLICSY